MALDTETLNSTVRNYVADVRDAMPIDRVFLFGSYAQGAATDESDIDLCFFSHSFENKRSVDVVTRLLRLAREYRSFDIEPHIFPTSEIQNDNPFVKEILRTGQEL
ncbi:MAG: nucleotidyltransferase domain-containing protein [Coriobacteriales bacterium]|jgi:predicted nucleotidyltransferase|nr:nucleotidyltransferase domain-containing protein [Coriobacteriales bacterium]